ncbi:MAG: four helix bundle protein [bacterium]|nr:four helix bundle protein [bacterium]
MSSGKIPKRDKLGIYREIEETTLETFKLVIDAVYKPRHLKRPILEQARIRIELVKQLVRTAHEIKSLEERNYLRFAEILQEISKMANGWIKYLDTQNPPVQGRM